MTPDDPTSPDRELLRTRVALVLIAVVAAVAVAWLAGPLGVPGLLYGLTSMYRWLLPTPPSPARDRSGPR